MRLLSQTIILLLSCWLSISCFAIDIAPVPLEELARESDLVVIASPVDLSLEKLDNPSLSIPDDLLVHVYVVRTQFTVEYTVKGESHKSIVLEHYRDRRIVPSGNLFSILEFESRPRTLTSSSGATNSQKWLYLLFLKKLDNGHFKLAVRPEWMESSVRIIGDPF